MKVYKTLILLLVLLNLSCSKNNQITEEITPNDIYLSSVSLRDEESLEDNIVDIIRNLKDEELAVVLVLTESCGASGKFFSVLDEVQKSVEEKGGRYILIDSKVLNESDEATVKIVTWMRKTFGGQSVPTVAVYRDGELVDFFQESSGHEDTAALTHMMYRNGIMDDFPGYASKIQDAHKTDKDTIEKRLKYLRVVDAYDLRGEDLSNMNLDEGVYNGSNFSSANLANTSFDRSVFFNANFCGANMKGASLMATLWKNTTCPDGSNSDLNGNSCINNIEAFHLCIDDKE